jgi:hypothetical protein
LATDKDQNDMVSYVAYGNRDGSTRITFRYLDGSTKTFENGQLADEGVASNTPTWWH